MTTRVPKYNGSTITVETTIEVGGSILKAEEAIAAAVNEVGMAATVEALKQFDVDGEPLMIGGEKWTAKQPKEKYYQTPYGEVLLARYAYQKAGGGKTLCPLEQEARILRNATPRFAKMVAHKLAQNAAADVQRDLEENHGRPVSKLLVQELGAYASAVVQAKEETWTYATPRIDADMTAVGIGMDGSCMLMCAGQWREAMTAAFPCMTDPVRDSTRSMWGRRPNMAKPASTSAWSARWRMSRRCTRRRALSALPMAPAATGISWRRMWTNRFSTSIMPANM